MTDHRQRKTRQAPAPRIRRRLLASGATGACLVAIMLAGPAQAQVTSGQAFQGTPTVVSGNANVFQSTGQDTITVNSPQAVINWTPNDRGTSGNIDFLPSGNTGVFQGQSNFTVLNRVIPINGQDVPVARMIELNGTITSQIVDAQGVPQGTGGNVWFYSPGGILVGANATIDVGGLVLSSRDIDTGGGLFGPNGEIRFRDPGLTGANAASVEVQGSITATNSVPGSSYVALVAPRVVQAGTVNSDGSVALVAAEVADITIHQGLFDIGVTVGTGDANGIVQTGSTGGPSDNSGTYDSRAYLVAVPKNQAMTMLVAGTLGFESVSNSTVLNDGSIVLSAGHNVTNGQIATAAPTGANASANISIAETRFRNTVNARATNDISTDFTNCTRCSPLGIVINGSGTFTADHLVDFDIASNRSLIVNGALRLASNGDDSTGNVNLASAGTVSVTGALVLDSGAIGSTGVRGGAADSGAVNLTLTGGTLSASSISLSADATGATGGTANAGDISFSNNGATLTTGNFSLSSEAGWSSSTPTGTSARAGDVSFTLGASSSTTATSIGISDYATAGRGTVQGGNATGGNVTFTSAASSTLTANSLDIYAFASAGNGDGTGNGGFAQGGTISVTASSPLPADMDFSVRASGGNSGSLPPTGTGGNAAAGTISLTLQTGSFFLDDVGLEATAFGGLAGNSAGIGGNANGGTINVSLLGGASLVMAPNRSLLLETNGTGGIGGATSGSGFGGNAFLTVNGGSTLSADFITLMADGYGGSSPFDANRGLANTLHGGLGQGGNAQVTNFGTITTAPNGQLAPSITIHANGSGGDAAPANGNTQLTTGGSAIGGTAVYESFFGTDSLRSLTLGATATSGFSGTQLTGPAGIGGSATGGTARINLFGSTFTTVQGVNASVWAGSASGDFGHQQLRQGGIIDLLANGGAQATIGTGTNFDARAIGGYTAQPVASDAGANGGSISLRFFGGSNYATTGITGDVSASTRDSAGAIGDARAGTISLSVLEGSTFAITNPGPGNYNYGNFYADARAGTGPLAGSATGGSITIDLADGTFNTGLSTYVSASGYAGVSTTTPSSEGPLPRGNGGTVNITLDGSPDNLLTGSGLIVNADAGSSNNFDGFYNPGNVGTNAYGGTVSLLLAQGTIDANYIALQASAYGTQGSAGFGGNVTFNQIGGLYTYSPNNSFPTLSLAASGNGGESLPGQTGGTGYGGIVDVLLNSGTFNGVYLYAEADGSGGDGFDGGSSRNEFFEAGVGGIGQGGHINLTMDGDATITSPLFSLRADGFGGAGGNFFYDGGPTANAGSAGTGYGGTVLVDLSSGTLTVDQFEAYANGYGRFGGDIHTSGEGEILPLDGSVTSTAARGGNAVGGSATINLATDTTVGTHFRIDTSATAAEGGAGLVGGPGGDANGGVSKLLVDDFDAGTLNVTLVSEAFGGEGQFNFHGTGGSGGYGQGGQAIVEVSGPNGHAVVQDNAFFVSGNGGDGMDGTNAAQFSSFPPVPQPLHAGDGGNGGTGIGGTISLITTGGLLEIAPTTRPGVLLRTTGYGGDAGNGANNDFGPPTVPTFGGNAGFAGDGIGGTVELIANGGLIVTTENVPFEARVDAVGGIGGSGGRGTSVPILDPMTGQEIGRDGGDGYYTGDGYQTGGLIRLQALDGADGPGLIDLTETLLNANAFTGGRAELLDDASGEGLHFGNLTVDANDGGSFSSLFSCCGSGLYIRSTDGAIQIDGSLNLQTGGAFGIDADGTGGLAVGDFVNITAAYQTYGSHTDNSARNATLLASSINITTSSLLFGAGTLIQADGNVTISANGAFELPPEFNRFVHIGAIQFGDIKATGGSIFLDASGYIAGGKLSAFGLVSTNSAGTGNFTPPTFTQGDTRIASITADRASLTAANAISVSQLNVAPTDFGQGERLQGPPGSGDAVLNAGGSITLGTVSVTNLLDAIAGVSIDVGQGSVGGDMLLDAGLDIAVGTAGPLTVGGDATLNAARNINAVNLATIGAGAPNTISLTAGGTTGWTNLTSSGDITIDSGDVLATGTATAANLFSAVTHGSTSLGLAGDISVGTVNAATIVLNSQRDILFTSLHSDGNTSLVALRSIIGNSTVADDGNIGLTANGRDIDVTSVNAGDALSVNASQNVRLGTTVSNYETFIAGGSSVTITSATTTGIGSQQPRPNADINIFSGGTTTLGSLNSAEDIFLSSTRIAGLESSITAVGNATIRAADYADLNTVNAASVNINTSYGIVQFASIHSTGDTSINGENGVFGGSINTDTGLVSVASGEGNVDVASVTSGSTSEFSANQGSVHVGSLNSAGQATFTAALDAGLDNGFVNNALLITAGRDATVISSNSSGATTITATGNAIVLNDARAQTTLSITGANVSAANAFLTAPDLQITATAGDAVLGTTSAGSTTVDASEAIRFGQLFGGSLSLTAGSDISGDEISGSDLTADAANDISIGRIFTDDGTSLTAGNLISGDYAESFFGDVTLDGGTVDYGEIYAGGQIDISATGNVTIGYGETGGEGCIFNNCEASGPGQHQFASSGNVNDILIAAGGTVALGTLDSAQNIVISGRSLTGSSSELIAADRVTITTTNDATFGSIDADDGVNVSSGGLVTGEAVTTNRLGGAVNLSGNGGLDIDVIRSADLTTLAASNATASVTDLQSVGAVEASGRALAITSTDNIVYTSATATAGNADLVAQNGNLTVNAASASGGLNLSTNAGSIVLGNASAGSANLRSVRDATISGTASATGTMQITTSGSTIVNGIATGQTVRVRSADIVIGSSGRIGTTGTTSLVDLTNGDGSGRTFIGGSDVTGDYSLSSTEMTRLFGGDIAIHAPRASAQDGKSLGSTRPPDVVIGAFTITGGSTSGGNLGSAGTLSIDTPGSLRVTGAGRIDSASASNGLSIVANEAIEVIQGQGSLRVGTANGLTGSLNLTSDDIVVATSSAISDIALATTTDAIDTRLSQNDSSLSEDGALAAGTIRFNAIRGVYVQNSGTGTDNDARRGFTANALVINTESSATRIVINGRVANSEGALQSGVEALKLATINGIVAGTFSTGATSSASFDPLSTINGCLILGQSGCGRSEGFFPVQDTIDNGLEGNGGTTAINILIDIRDVAPLPNDPLVDEPVTGAGNDDLWSNGDDEAADCEAAGGQSCPAG